MEWLDHNCEYEPSGFQMLYRVDGDPRVTEQELTRLTATAGLPPYVQGMPLHHRPSRTCADSDGAAVVTELVAPDGCIVSIRAITLATAGRRRAARRCWSAAHPFGNGHAKRISRVASEEANPSPSAHQTPDLRRRFRTKALRSNRRFGLRP